MAYSNISNMLDILSDSVFTQPWILEFRDVITIVLITFIFVLSIGLLLAGFIHFCAGRKLGEKIITGLGLGASAGTVYVTGKELLKDVLGSSDTGDKGSKASGSNSGEGSNNGSNNGGDTNNGSSDK